MSKQPMDLNAIRLAHANLDRIAREHPELIDPARANWSEEDISEMIVDPTRTTYSTKDVAEILGVHEETVRREVQRGHLKAAKLGRMFIISKADLAAYYEAKGGGKLFADDDGAGS